MGYSKFTPGPWEALPSHIRLTGETSRTKFPDGRWVVNPVDDYERVPLAEVDQGDDIYPPARKQAEYNAKLIATSPELYRALESTNRELEMVVNELNEMKRKQICSTDLDSPDYHDQQTVHENMVLLAKARGERTDG